MGGEGGCRIRADWGGSCLLCRVCDGAREELGFRIFVEEVGENWRENLLTRARVKN